MIVAIIVSLLAGFTLVTARVANAKLADETSALMSTFYNYFIGLLVSLVVLLLVGRSEWPLPSPLLSSHFWIYLGGPISIFVVFIVASASSKIPTFYMTLLLFVGQLFASIIIDTFVTGHFSIKQVIGGLLVAFGFTLNLFLDREPQTRPKTAFNNEA